MTMQCWPPGFNYFFAKRVGDIMYLFDRRHRNRAMANLRNSFPKASEASLKIWARDSMRQLICLGVDVIWTTRLVKPDNFDHFVEMGDFRQALELLLSKHKGLILITGHYGNWEILGYVLATLGCPTVSVARPLDNPLINEFVLGVRERKGQKIIDKKGATNDVTAALSNGGMVGFIADQNAGPKGIFVDFFGRKASAYKSIGLLAMQYNVPIVVGYARRTREDAFKFNIGTQDVIYPVDWQDKPDTLLYITQRYTKAIEDFVTAEPGQYLWVHRRWKTRPKNEQPGLYD